MLSVVTSRLRRTLQATAHLGSRPGFSRAPLRLILKITIPRETHPFFEKQEARPDCLRSGGMHSAYGDNLPLGYFKLPQEFPYPA